MNRLPLIVVLLLLLSVADAKCISIGYTITGIVSGPDGAPISNAEVTLTFSLGSQGSVVHTNVYGRYNAELGYAPNDDLPNPQDPKKHLCAERPSELSVHIFAEGYEPLVSNLGLSSEQATANYSLKRTAAERLR